MRRNTILLSVLGLIAIGAIVLASRGPSGDSGSSSTNQPRFCAEELKFCPDGSVVGRVLPSCDFSPCAGEAASAYAEGWRTLANPTAGYTLRYPQGWSATGTDSPVTLTGSGHSLELRTVVDDTPLWESTNHRALPVGGVVSTQADYGAAGSSTRSVWVPMDTGYLVASWAVDGGDETPYYQILATLQRTE